MLSRKKALFRVCWPGLWDFLERSGLSTQQQPRFSPNILTLAVCYACWPILFYLILCVLFDLKNVCPNPLNWFGDSWVSHFWTCGLKDTAVASGHKKGYGRMAPVRGAVTVWDPVTWVERKRLWGAQNSEKERSTANVLWSNLKSYLPD